MKKLIIWIVVLAAVGVSIYFITKNLSNKIEVTSDGTTPSTNTTATTNQNPSQSVIGKSVEGRDIVAYNYGTGETKLLFVGGIHGGYEWNTALVAYQMMDYLKNNPNVVPNNLKVTVIPVLNPDGLNKVVGTTTGNFSLRDVPSSSSAIVAGRFNVNNVDLNRNFDCDWQPNATWQNKTVSGGSVPFSEPESLALKNYVETNNPRAVVVWYSAVGGVFSSNCHNGVLTETRTLTNTYAEASGYKAFEEFNFYEITGDAVNWLAKKNIPAISVLLTNHTDTEWSKNQKGVEALLKYYAKQ